MSKVDFSPNQAAAAAFVAAAHTIFQAITISIQNCNSLNVSTNCPKQLKKVKALLELKSDIILLSDIRLNNSPNTTDLVNSFRSASSTPYDFF